MTTETSTTRVWCIWALLVGTSLLAWTESRFPASTGVIIVVLGLTLVKIVLVMAYYMEVRHAPNWLRAACSIWAVVSFGSLVLLLAFQGL